MLIFLKDSIVVFCAAILVVRRDFFRALFSALRPN